MKYKLFISDYDGTLAVGGTSEIDESTTLAIKNYVFNGGKFVLCSGRPFTSIKSICDKYGITGLAVSMQGAMINDIKTGEKLFSTGIDAVKAAEVVNKLKSENGVPIAYVDDVFYYDEHDDKVKAYEKRLNFDGVKVDDLALFLLKTNKPVSKVCLLCKTEVVDEVMNKYNAEYKKETVVFNSGSKLMVEVINSKFDKGTAVKFLAKHFDIPLNEVIAVGDSTNDIPLVNGEWYGVAVGDGRQEIKDVADEITVPLQEKPVYTLLKKYCLE